MNDHFKITGLAEVVLNVTDLNRSVDFYQTLMGFQLHSSVSLEETTPAPEGDPTIVFLTIRELDTPLGDGGHPQLLALIDYRRHVFTRRRMFALNISQSPLNHIAFEVSPSSLDAHAERLAACGIETTRMDFPSLNASAIYFSDPDGNTLELIANSSEHAVERSGV
jgi:catechol 2,3-dioxygenase-like lactoylglutathione lyase family enzyme